MQKRIVIFLIAAAIAIGVYVASPLSEPKVGSAEYHKRQYWALLKRTALDEWSRMNVIPSAWQRAYWQRKVNRVKFHRRALFECGYLTNREFAVSNRLPNDVAGAVWRDMQKVFTSNTWGFTEFTLRTNGLTVTAPAEAMGKLGELIREADLPK